MNKTIATASLALALGAGLAAPAFATQPDFICPETGNGWVKTDGVTGQSALVDAPLGFLIAEVCYKAGPNSTTYTVAPVGSVLIVSTLVNNGGQIADISHYSVRLVPVPTPDPTGTPTPEPTPTATVTPTPDPTRTVEPTPFPPLEPPAGPTLAPTGVEAWFWVLLGLAVAAVPAGWWIARRSHDSERSTN